jgi:hypothetical protein
VKTVRGGNQQIDFFGDHTPENRINSGIEVHRILLDAALFANFFVAGVNK